MACCLFSAKQLSKPIPGYCGLDPEEQTSSKCKIFKNASKCIICEMSAILSRGDELTHWGRVTHICVSKLAIIGTDNGLLPGRRQAIIWTKAGILLIEPLGTNLSEMSIGIQIFSFKKMRLKMSSAKWRPICLECVKHNKAEPCAHFLLSTVYYNFDGNLV